MSLNPSTERALNRLLKKMERPTRRPRGRLSIAPLILGFGLAVMYLLLTRLVPAVWSQFLPGGLDQAQQFRGWPGLVWSAAKARYYNSTSTAIWMGGAVLGSMLLSVLLRPLGILVWLAAIVVIGLNAGIVYVTMRIAIEAMAQGAGAGASLP
jgi:hypothetical protein